MTYQEPIPYMVALSKDNGGDVEDNLLWAVNDLHFITELQMNWHMMCGLAGYFRDQQTLASGMSNADAAALRKNLSRSSTMLYHTTVQNIVKHVIASLKQEQLQPLSVRYVSIYHERSSH